jgi:hypothetical protein
MAIFLFLQAKIYVNHSLVKTTELALILMFVLNVFVQTAITALIVKVRVIRCLAVIISYII